MVEGITKRHFQNEQLDVGKYVCELCKVIDLFEDLYTDYQQSKCYHITTKIAQMFDTEVDDDSFLTRYEWQNSVDLASIQLSISNKYIQVLDFSATDLILEMCQ